jgi:hypothetical protein
MENSDEIINKGNYGYTKSKYNPALDNLKGEIIFKKKFEEAREILFKTVFPKEVIDLMIRNINKTRN